jgi:hypothetical protein
MPLLLEEAVAAVDTRTEGHSVVEALHVALLVVAVAVVFPMGLLHIAPASREEYRIARFLLKAHSPRMIVQAAEVEVEVSLLLIHHETEVFFSIGLLLLYLYCPRAVSLC